ncbi:MAG: tRNA lysidine(34) synthetase TilS [Sphingobacteriales bacterium]|nr:tRNA lysidine(34) synthetase TilS [Sphingobacteriales bacterium]
MEWYCRSATGKYVQSSTHRIIKNRNWIIISPNKTTESHHILIEVGDKKIIFEGGVIEVELMSYSGTAIENDNRMALIDFSKVKFPLLLRRCKTGDYFYPLGMQKKKKLSRFFIDQKMSLTEKENTWVIESDKRIMWVVNRRIDDRYKITAATAEVIKFKFS